MLRLYGGYAAHRNAHFIAFGFSEDNLRLMVQDGKPVSIRGESIGLPPPGTDFIVFAGASQDQMKERLLKMLEPYDSKDKLLRVNCLHMGGSFYLVHFLAPDGKLLYLIGLDDVSCHKLRSRDLLNFRARTLQGDMLSVEVVIFWGPTEEIMEEQFYAAGMIGPNTQVKKL